MYILGLSFFYHDSASCLIKDGKVIAASCEERFTRKKHDSSFPINSINFCLEFEGININEISYICFYEKPIIKFERLLTTYIKTWPKCYYQFLKGFQSLFKEKIWVKIIIKEKLKYEGSILFTKHHLSHAASAFYVSSFEEAAIVTLDGVGEWDTTTIGIGKGNNIQLKKTIHFPHSIGLLYSSITHLLGFRVDSDEYKVMGLAPYGKPIYCDLIKEQLIDIKDDGSFRLNMKHFAYEYGLSMSGKKLERLFGLRRRKLNEKIEDIHEDIAASIQKVTEEIILKITKHAKEITGSKNLCLAGGVALNSVANGKVVNTNLYKEIFIQPAGGDAGGAVGAALYAYYSLLKNKRKPFGWKHDYFGAEYSNDYIRGFLDENNISYNEYSDKKLLENIAKEIDNQKIVGWFQGRSEFGPRALGNRSILADARNKNNWDIVNKKIKFRESFRPFAPSVLIEKCNEYFELEDTESPFMLLVSNVKNDSIPAVTHIDNTARVQTVSAYSNEKYYKLISEFDNITGCPVILNTSFNLSGEPIVNSPKDAFDCFNKTNMDILVLGNFIVEKRYA